MQFRRSVVFLFCLMLSAICSAQTTTKYFGYYYNDASSYNSSATAFSENYNRINLYHISTWAGNTTEAGRAGTISYTLSQLELARSNGVKAIITATPFVFQYNSAGQWQIEPNASAEWSNFVSQMVAAGYIVPGNPTLSTVVAIYVIDEPDLIGLADQNGQVHPAIANAISAIRGNSATSSIPLATITGYSWYNVEHAIELMDWIGFDDYSLSQGAWNSTYNDLVSALAPNQKTIIVPKAATGGGACGVGGGATTYSDPWAFYDTLQNDARVAWLAPFRWFSPASNCLGVRDIPSLRTPYEQIGQTMKDASNPSMGELDGLLTGTDGVTYLSGWACTKGIPQSVNVDLYAGLPYGAGGVGMGRFTANLPSEPAVAAACGVASGNYRFQIAMTPQLMAQFSGQRIFAYSIATFNGNNNMLGNSGTFLVP
jgi:hypothetical protein